MASDKLTLVSSDGQHFEVDAEAIIEASGTIGNMVEDTGAEEPIPLPNVSGSILARVIEYVNFHRDDGTRDEASRKAFDDDFVKVEQGVLFDIILAANYLNIKALLDLTCQTVALMIKGKTPEEIRKTFNIKNDFTPEEEEEVRRENQWAFD